MLHVPRAFAIEAATLLLLGLCGRRLLPAGSDIQIHNTYFVFSPVAVCFGMAALLCTFATAYSILSVARAAMSCHFWITTPAIVSFWMSFYLWARTIEQNPAGTLALASAIVLVASIAIISISVLFFLGNIGIALGRHIRSIQV